MEASTTLLSDDERVSFATRLGWDPAAGSSGDDLERRAQQFFTVEHVAGIAGDEGARGISQAQLDEVREAVLRRERRFTLHRQSDQESAA